MANVYLWWRDDDFGRWIPNSRRICQISAKKNVPLIVAVVPYRLAVTDKEFQREIRNFSDTVAFCVHGFDHLSHDKTNPNEYPGTRDLDTVRAELDYGLKKVRGVFGAMFKPIFVPPWNVMSEEAANLLPNLGYRATSGTAKTCLPENKDDYRAFPIQVDLLDYRQRPFKLRPHFDIKNELKEIFNLAQKAKSDVFIGILTHHVEMEDASLNAVEEIIEYCFSLGYEPAADHPLLPTKTGSD